jgi:Ser-tRNA(Ala) deacylase AlaX
MQYPETKLLYLTDMFTYQTSAQLLAIETFEGEMAFVLDQTLFYPQGGGQPSDQGTITDEHNALFTVTQVRKHEGGVYHKGTLEHGTFTSASIVTLHINQKLRQLYSRLHTAGHLIDYALSRLGYQFVSTKGYHFPQGAYVEYESTLEQEEREALTSKLQEEAQVLINLHLPVQVKFIDPITRVMILENYPPIPCGGTHVANTGDIGTIHIRKIKNEKGHLRISYSIEP